MRPTTRRSPGAVPRGWNVSGLRTDRRIHKQLLAAASPLDAYALARLTGGSPMECARSLQRLQAAGKAHTMDAQDCADNGLSCEFRSASPRLTRDIQSRVARTRFNARHLGGPPLRTGSPTPSARRVVAPCSRSHRSCIMRWGPPTA